MDPWGDPYGGIEYNGHPCFLVKTPRDHIYMKAVRFAMRTVSGWPGRELGEKTLFFEGFLRYYNVFLSNLFLVLQSWYLIDNISRLSFFEVGNMYIAMLMNVLSMSRAWFLCFRKQYRMLAHRFITEMDVFFHKDTSDFSRKVYAEVYFVSKWFTAYLVVIIGLSLVLFNFVPCYINYRNGLFETFTDPVNKRFELSIYFKLPVDPEKHIKAYWISFIWNCYAAYLCASSIIAYDILLSLMVFHLWGHFKILLHNLDCFPKPAALTATDGGAMSIKQLASMYTPEENVEIAAKLKECIVYHTLIKDFVNEMSDVFGIVLFVYYMFHQLSGCLLLLECSQGGEALARYLPLTIMMTAQLIQISVIFEIIGTSSEKLIDEVYCLPWEHMNTKNRKTVLLFLNNVQEPIHVKACGLVDVGVTTMAGILKTSFSYFAFLRTMDH